MDPITRYDLAKFEIAQRHEQAARERLVRKTGLKPATSSRKARSGGAGCSADSTAA